MAATIGALGVVASGCGTCVAAEPPPPFVPAYTADDALARFRAGPCAAALGGTSATPAGLRGIDAPDGPAVILDLELATAPSKLGVRYRTGTAVALAPATGEVADPAACRALLAELVGALDRAAAAAEADPKVQAFVAAHGPADRLRATWDGALGPRGRIVFVAPPDGAANTLVWP